MTFKKEKGADSGIVAWNYGWGIQGAFRTLLRNQLASR
jgi:hypothetical protein